MWTKMKTPWKIVSIFSFFAILIVILTVVSHENVKKNAEEKFAQLNSLVHVGMNIDDASSILKRNGFNVEDKHLSVKKDYYQMRVI